MTLNKSLVCLAIASLSIPAMAAPVTTEGAGVGKHGDVIAAVTFDGGRIQAIDIRKSNENPILAGKVFTEMKDAMIKHNTGRHRCRDGRDRLVGRPQERREGGCGQGGRDARGPGGPSQARAEGA